MNADVARTLIAGQKIKYWDDRIATITIPYIPPVPPVQRGEIALVFDADTQEPKSVHFIWDNDFRLAEPL